MSKAKPAKQAKKQPACYGNIATNKLHKSRARRTGCRKAEVAPGNRENFENEAAGAEAGFQLCGHCYPNADDHD